MSLEDKIKATAKNIEGKIQEVVGEVTGNPEDKVAGQAKQTEAEIRHTVENIKDKAKETLN